MKYLLDTNVFIWWVDDNARLKSSWRETISNPENFIFVSSVTAWEMSIKMRNNKLKLRKSWEVCFGNLEFDSLPISMSHVKKLHELPLHHKDPFDRMIVAQALIEGCAIITADPKLHKYRVPILE